MPHVHRHASAHPPSAQAKRGKPRAAARAKTPPAAPAADRWQPSPATAKARSFHISQYPGRTNTRERTRANGNCGPVSTLMALKAFGKVQAAPGQVDGLVSEIRRRGGARQEERIGRGSATSTHQLARAARSYGLRAKVDAGASLREVSAALDRGELVVALVKPGAYARSRSKGHYVVVTEVRQGVVIVNDPAQQHGNRAIPTRAFAQAMKLKGGQTVTMGLA